MIAGLLAHTFATASNEQRRGPVSNNISKPAATATPVDNEPDARKPSDATWIVPFYVFITSGVAFFFWQIAQYHLLSH